MEKYVPESMELKEILNLPYHIIIRRMEDDKGVYYYAKVLEWPGCNSHGENPAKAWDSIMESMELWIETKREHGERIAAPLDTSKAKGNFSVRGSKALHEQLLIEAELQGVSLNQWASHKLAQSVPAMDLNS